MKQKRKETFYVITVYGSPKVIFGEIERVRARRVFEALIHDVRPELKKWYVLMRVRRG